MPSSRRVLPFVLALATLPATAQVQNCRLRSELVLGADDETHDVAVAGIHAYVARGVHGVDVIDISSPTAPARVATIDPAPSSDIVDVVVHQGVLYAVNGSDVVDPAFGNYVGVYLYGLANPAAPALLTAIWWGNPAIGWGWRAAMNRSGFAASVGGLDYLFLTSEITNAVECFEVTAPALPVFKGTIPAPASLSGNGIHDAVVQGTTLYATWVATLGSGGFSLHDLSALPSVSGMADPYGPQAISLVLAHSPGAHLFHVWPNATGTHLCAADGGTNGPLRIYSLFPAPALVASVPGGAGTAAHSVMVSGNLAYVARFQDGLRVVDITNPASPAPYAWFDTSPLGPSTNAYTGALGLALGPGNRVHVTDSRNGLFTIDSGTGPASDGVAITSLRWRNQNSELTIRATSTGAPSAQLTAIGIGSIPYRPSKGWYELKVTLPSRPSSVTVVSTLGGLASGVP